MLYKIKSLFFVNQILLDANFQMDGLAPTTVFFFSFPFLPSLFLGWKEAELELCLQLYLEGAIALNGVRLGTLKEKPVFQGDLVIISLFLQRNV